MKILTLMIVLVLYCVLQTTLVPYLKGLYHGKKKEKNNL